jgi:cell division septation protein DedD
MMQSMTRAIRFLLVNAIAGVAFCVVMASTASECAAQAAPTTEPAKTAPATKPKTTKSKAKAAAASAKKDPAEAQKALDAGIRAYQSAKYDAAVQQFDRALADGGLPANQVARALYYRGIVYRKQNKPALAISDLTNALWLKGGLSEQERADANAHRTQAYREAGLTEPPSSSDTTATSGEPRAPTSSKEGPRTAAAAAEAAPETSSSGIAGFFSNLLSGGSSSSPSAALTSDGSPEPAPTRPPPSPSRSVGTSWSSTTEVPAAPAPAPKPERKAVAKAPAPPRPMTTGSLGAKASGGIRINIATLRSRPEAQAVVERVKREHSGSLTREPTIEETAAASGAVYSVRIGPFANAEESRELCAQLRKSGLECMILAK